MFGEKAFELIKELERTPDSNPVFNDDLVRQVLAEINAVFDENHADA